MAWEKCEVNKFFKKMFFGSHVNIISREIRRLVANKMNAIVSWLHKKN
jgi:hypothetical protein